MDNDGAAKHLIDVILKLRNPDDKTEPLKISTIDFIEHLLCWPNCLLMDYWDEVYRSNSQIQQYIYENKR